MSEQKRLDRPDREKIARLITGEPSKMEDGSDDPLHEMDVMNNLELADQILALFDTELEVAKREERERILRILKYLCKLPNGNYHITDEDWQALKGAK